MTGNRKLLIVMTALLVFFTCGSLVLHFDVLSRIFPEQETVEGEEIAVSLISTDQVAAVEWLEGDTPLFSLEKDGQGQWVCPEYAGEPLDQDKASGAVTALCQVISSRKIDDLSDLASYGLSPAVRRVRISLTDGDSVVYLLGSLNTYTNRYYFQLEGEKAVHTVGYSVGQAMNYHIQDLVVTSDSKA